MSKIDDKSGYDHILLSPESQQYFGIAWQGVVASWCYAPVWLEEFPPLFTKLLAWVQRIFFRNLGVACSLYIDDRFKWGVVFFGGFLVAPHFSENSGLQLSVCDGGLVYSLQSSCWFGLFLGYC